MTLNASTNLPGGMTHADYNRLAGSKVEFIRVNELPTSYIKEYPTIYILMKDDSIGIMYEYNSSTNTWLKYGGDLGIIPITGEEYDNLSEEDKNKDVFYLITDRIAYLENVTVMKGASSDTDGKTGTVPVPKAGDQNKFLRADGEWVEVKASGGGSDITPYTVTTGEDGSIIQSYDDGRQIIITQTAEGIKEVAKDANGNIIYETICKINQDGSIRYETVTSGGGEIIPPSPDPEPDPIPEPSPDPEPEEVPIGDTVEPINDIQIWLKCAEINDKDYTELSQVLADTTTIYTLVNDENAMKYLARSTDFSETLCNDETFMTYLGQSAYVDNTVLNSDLWVEKICNSQYMDKVLNDLVPAMTSNTSSVGTAYISPNSDKYPPYHMFDKVISSSEITVAGVPEYSTYPHYYGMTFTINKMIYAISLPIPVGHSKHPYPPKDCILQISDNGSDWKDIKQFTLDNTGGSNNLIVFSPVYTKYIRIKANNGYYTTYNWSGIFEWYIYGR